MNNELGVLIGAVKATRVGLFWLGILMVLTLSDYLSQQVLAY